MKRSLLGAEKMKKRNVMLDLERGEMEAEDIAEKVVNNPDLLPELFAGISSTNPKVKFGSAKTLRVVSEKDPKTIYSQMGFFENLLDSENTILKWIAIDIIANLTSVDTQDRFSRMFKKFYSLLDEGNLITAAHVVDGSGKIALAKPELQDRITKELLRVKEIPLPTEECRNILIGKVIKAFEAYCDKAKDRNQMVSFAEQQLNNPRNATKAKAEKYLKRLGKQTIRK